MVKALKTITWQDIIRMLNSDVYLYELGRKWGNDFLTSEQQAAMIRKYQNELLDLQDDLADYTSLPLPDSATLIGIFMARCVIAELINQEPVASDEILKVDYSAKPDQFDSRWTITIYNPVADEEMIGVAELSYAEILGMRVAIDDDTDFMEQTQQIALFFDEYVASHPDDPNLPDEIALFWPLTTGIMAPLDADDPASPLISTMQLDPKLLSGCTLRFGQAFRRFKGE